MQLLYNLFFFVAFLFVAPFYAVKMVRRGRSGRGFGQRFGLFGPRARRRIEAARGGVWIHAVSVGEANIAVLLIREWKRRHPAMPVILSTTTITGHDVARRQLGEDFPLVFNPLDFLPCVRAAFNALRPRVLVLVESELWPNYLWEADRRSIPVLMANARLSPRTESRYRALNPLVRPFLNRIERICVQNPRDHARFESLGVPPARMALTGSMKYDVSRSTAGGSCDAAAILRGAGWRPGRPIWLVGSTHRGEEALAARVFLRLRERHPDLFLVVAPRHFERGGEVSRALAAAGVVHARRSKPAAAPADCAALVLDSTGELKYFYPHATVTFVGKSLRGRGGQNFLEPLQAGHPVVFGPHMENFEPIATEFVEAGVVDRVLDEAGLEAAVAHWLAHPEAALERAARARALFVERCGATERTVDALSPWIPWERDTAAEARGPNAG